MLLVEMIGSNIVHKHEEMDDTEVTQHNNSWQMMDTKVYMFIFDIQKNLFMRCLFLQKLNSSSITVVSILITKHNLGWKNSCSIY